MADQHHRSQRFLLLAKHMEQPVRRRKVQIIKLLNPARPLSSPYGPVEGVPGTHGRRGDRQIGDLALLGQETAHPVGCLASSFGQWPVVIGTGGGIPVGFSVAKQDDGLHDRPSPADPADVMLPAANSEETVY